MESIQSLAEQMSSKDALDEIAGVVKKLFQHTDEQGRLDFIMKVTGETGGDKISSMVNL
jgi:hypothetical protein